MDSNMSTAAYVHRPGGSSSASSACTSVSSVNVAAGNGNGGGGGRMAVIGVTRNVRLRRRGASGFGFSLRGGREYAAGFYVSDVQPGGEAHRNGLRVGDQILRVNGYPVEDAVHQEVALLAKNQQVLVLKIRSVGMIPVKDNPNDPVTWHMVQQQQQQLQYGEAASNEIRIRVLLGEKGRLGCGVCRGIVPGLTVQGTREGGPARAAGLKAGDVILWCNGQRLTDLPFERAIDVMRGSSVLDLVVSRPIPNHLYDCPEALWMRGSSGYDSENSSILGATSPPPVPTQNPASSPQHRPGDNRLLQPCNRIGRNCCPPSLSTSSSSSSDWNQDQQEWSRKPNNTTVIRINHQNHPPNNYNQQFNRRPPPPPVRGGIYDDVHDLDDEEPLYDPVPPKDYEVHDFDANPREEINRRAEYRREHGIRESTYDPQIDERTLQKENNQPEGNRSNEAQRQTEMERKATATVEVHQPCPPAPPSMPPPMPYKWPGEVKPMNAMGMQMGSTMSMGSTGSTETESSLESSCGKDSASTSSSLSTSSCEPASTASYASTVTATNVVPANKTPELSTARAPRTATTKPNPPAATIDLGTAITQELQRRAKQRSMNNASAGEASNEKSTELRKSQNADTARVQEKKVAQHDKLMEEFKRAHQRMFSNAQQRNQVDGSNEQEQDKKVLNNNAVNSAGPLPPPLPKNAEDVVEMPSMDSFKLKDSPPVPTPKPPSTYFPMTTFGQGTKVNGGESTNGPIVDGPKRGNLPSPGTTVSSTIINGQKSVSKVAIRIGAYEGETKAPSRLDFLPQQAQKLEKPNPDETPAPRTEPAVSRLQNELAATLQRSNLRRKTEGENGALKTFADAQKLIPSQGTLPPQGNVEKLASALNNKVTIRVNPENGAR